MFAFSNLLSTYSMDPFNNSCEIHCVMRGVKKLECNTINSFLIAATN